MTDIPAPEPTNVVPASTLERMRQDRALLRMVRSTILGSTLSPEPPICRACGRLLGHRHGGAA